MVANTEPRRWLATTPTSVRVAADAAVAALPAIGTAVEVSGENAVVKAAKPVLSERDQKVVAVLRKMTSDTWQKDRDADLALLLG